MNDKNGEGVTLVRFFVIVTMGLLGSYLSEFQSDSDFSWTVYFIRSFMIIAGVYLGGYLIDVIEKYISRMRSKSGSPIPEMSDDLLKVDESGSSSESVIARTTTQKSNTERYRGILDSGTDHKS